MEDTGYPQNKILYDFFLAVSLLFIIVSFLSGPQLICCPDFGAFKRVPRY